MDLLQTIIFGLVEGITEFLPISSTGHLILTANLLKLTQTEFLKSFEITIQLGAILAVVVLYGRSFLINREVIKKLIIAFIPTAIIGLLFYKIVKFYLLGSNQVVLWSLFVGGILLIIFELLYKEKETATEKISEISWQKVLVIGIFQSVAIIPGVSRAAATIIGGLLMGLKRKTIVEFSFLLAMPTMLAATGLDLVKSASAFQPNDFFLLAVGFSISFLVAIFSIRFLLAFIKNHTFIWFGVYRIILVLFFWLVMLR